ncbi:MAG: type II toxin-antitoxin system VapB family antitoxin [Actinobacteria bacterium]|nr:type II toxin-antitoxin system VapB family antitoxin [Actinomycetota bacterium]MBM3702855.1 type II toxin-antitoxin system VapB family antitoxin [Actinomycetota bacterium]MBU4313512.1 type II toxin-antitoxin system VapB family antitoxin [Actinomycetota bacterium]MBU4483009.1 type II toxin-antitoxin system VapB family antitoxin [Actinomycetota bacterium]MCG2790349.1 type II toxin-antitoxin system VapB family antitoxin [Actinomycetes bacterium]
MRTNIVLDDNLLKEAFKYADMSTKKDIVNLALKEFIENHRRLDMRELKGKVKFREDYDYKKLRRGV